MKVAINACFGGFGLSGIAIKELIKRNAKCLESYTPKKYYGGDNENSVLGKDWESRWKKDRLDFEPIGEDFFSDKWGPVYHKGLIYNLGDRYDNKVRTDKDLIEVIEMLGDKANGMCADLKIIEIPDDVDWYIHEYDGNESVYEQHRSWG